ncbi:MAG: hypothetical protein OEL76_10340 [Siculibacillus sp.]|nr:hypothetical protein [Siculibacillus sp.]
MTSPPEQPQATLRLTQANFKRKRKYRFAPLIFIGVPTLAALIYCFVLASNVYFSETLFAIRQSDASAGGGKAGGGGGLLAGIAGAEIAFDGFALRDFIQSADALDHLERTSGFARRTADRGIDPLYSYSSSADQDTRLAAFRRLVTVRYSLTEQMLSMSVGAYSAEDARAISDGLIAIAESFANRANERSRRDALELAQTELTRAEQRAVAAQLALNEWRLARGNVDPKQSIQMIQTVVGQLEQAASQVQADLASLPAQIDAQSARRRQLEARLGALREQIRTEQDKLTGGPDSVSNLLRDYDKLNLELEFANKQVTSARESLEQARLAMVRQTKYISIISNPTVAVRPSHPATLKIVPTVFVLSALIYGVLSMVLAMVRETHA